MSSLFSFPSTDCSATLGFFMPSGYEWIVLLIIGLLLFGRRLPEVGKWLGQGIVEFKKGIKGVTDDIEEASDPRKTERLADQSHQQGVQHSTAEKTQQES